MSDDSLQFFCAIDEGIVLSIAKSGDLVADLDSVFNKLARRFGTRSKRCIGFDCILRYIEMEQGRDAGRRLAVCCGPTTWSASTPTASSSAPCI